MLVVRHLVFPLDLQNHAAAAADMRKHAHTFYKGWNKKVDKRSHGDDLNLLVATDELKRRLLKHPVAMGTLMVINVSTREVL